MGKVFSGVKLNLDKERNFNITLNAMIRYEEETGQSMMDDKFGENLGAKELRALLWSGLKDEDEELAIEQAGSMIHAGNMIELSNKMMKAYADILPEAEEEEKGTSKNKKSPTG